MSKRNIYLNKIMNSVLSFFFCKFLILLSLLFLLAFHTQGSTCSFCEAILRESGFRTGLFTSPHLIDVRERFRLDGLAFFNAYT